MIDLLRLRKNTSRLLKVENLCRNYFNIDLRIDKIIQNNLPTGDSSCTTVFMTDRNEIYALCTGDDSLKLADVKKVIKSMGMKAEEYLPPGADDDYFLRYGQRVFQSTFPYRKTVLPQETTFYQTLTPYSPALVRIGKINGEIRQYNKICQEWQKAFEFSYLRLWVQ